MCGWGTGFPSTLSFLSALHMNIIILTPKYETKPLRNFKNLFYLCLVLKDIQPKKGIISLPPMLCDYSFKDQ